MTAKLNGNLSPEDVARAADCVPMPGDLLTALRKAYGTLGDTERVGFLDANEFRRIWIPTGIAEAWHDGKVVFTSIQKPLPSREA